MCQGNRLHLEDVIGHLPGRGASLDWVNASDGIPTQAKPHRLGDVTITQGQRT